MANRTLDIEQAQVAIDFFKDANFSWHHRAGGRLEVDRGNTGPRHRDV